MVVVVGEAGGGHTMLNPLGHSPYIKSALVLIYTYQKSRNGETSTEFKKHFPKNKEHTNQ